MRTRNCVHAFLATTLAIAATPSDALAKAPQPVSPGAATPGAIAESRCPTFSWAGVPGARGYELAVFRLAEAPDEEPALVTRVALPGGARGWTPPVGDCLERGGRYAWSVTAAAVSRDAQAAALDWATPYLFEVEKGPSADELARAVVTIERRLEADRGGEERSSERTAVASSPRAMPSSGRDALGGEALASPTIGTRITSAASSPTLGDASLTVSQQVHLDASSAVFKNSQLFLWDDSDGNTALGRNALASIDYGHGNTAVGRQALSLSTRGETYSAFWEGSRNTAIGDRALQSNTSGFRNTASGRYALRMNTTGNGNTATGYGTLAYNTTGSGNTATGSYSLPVSIGSFNTANGSGALNQNTVGGSNTASGFSSLALNNTGNFNTAHGTNALRSNTAGHRNAALGAKALYSNSSGSNNSALGYSAGHFSVGSNNIMIHNNGGSSSSESHVLRIGQGNAIGEGPFPDSSLQSVFIQGIFGQPVDGSAGGVMIDSSGKLGMADSTRVVKQDIQDLGPLADRLLDLRPVGFRYRRDAATDPDSPLQFGLIAEEVAEVFPELVIFDAEGKPQTVKYHLLSSLLLGELQRQHEDLALLRSRLDALESQRSEVARD